MITLLPLFSLQTLIHLAISLLSAFTFFVLFRFVVTPVMKLQHYKSQGIPCHYFPVLGIFRKIFSGVKEDGDSFHYFKMQSKTAPSRVMCSNLASDATVSLRDPELIKQFCLTPENYVKDMMFLELIYGIIGKGLLTSEHGEWKKQRKIISSAFHFDFVKANLANIQQTARQNLYDLRKESLNDVHIMNLFQNITGEVVGKIFFGEQLNNFKVDGKPLTIVLADLLIELGSLNISPVRLLFGPGFIKKGVLPSHRRLMQRVKNFREICEKLIMERKRLRLTESVKEQAKKDMLDLLLEYSGEEEEGSLSHEAIIDQFATFFLAGMDTTGHLLTMVFYYIHKFPEYKQQLIEEIRRNFIPGKEVALEDLEKLEFMNAFIKETLRVGTPAPGVFQRRAIKDHFLGDIHIKKDDVILLDFPYNHYNSLYFAGVEKFEPMRWMDKERVPSTFAYIPFSAGPRNCIGQHFALNEVKIILCEFLTMYDCSLKEDYELRMKIKFMYEPADPIFMDLKLKDEEA